MRMVITAYREIEFEKEVDIDIEALELLDDEELEQHLFSLFTHKDAIAGSWLSVDFNHTDLLYE